ncbi:hypothetical protein [Rhizobium ruizarguesonis]|nr:hypothetical protein [Rhizobium ruizarguesonis]
MQLKDGHVGVLFNEIDHRFPYGLFVFSLIIGNVDNGARESFAVSLDTD